MIDKPYIIALRIPAALFSLCLVKKLTVIRIIGNTQGVNKAKKPIPSEKNIKENNPLFISSSSSLELELLEIEL